MVVDENEKMIVVVHSNDFRHEFQMSEISKTTLDVRAKIAIDTAKEISTALARSGVGTEDTDQRPETIAKHACELVENLFKEFSNRGWMIESKDIGQYFGREQE